MMLLFRDCMEEKKGRMLDMDAEEVGDIQTEICNGLKVGDHDSETENRYDE